MSTTKRLSPYFGAPGDSVNVLVVGSEGAGKHDVAKCLESTAPSLDLKILEPRLLNDLDGHIVLGASACDALVPIWTSLDINESVQIFTIGDFAMHTYTTLPVPDDSSLYRLGVEFICFVVDVANQDSLVTLLENMGEVDIDYFLGRAAIIANTKAAATYEGNNVKKLEQVAAKYGIPVLFRNTQVESESTNLGRTLTSQIKVVLGYVPGVSPILLSGGGGWEAQP